jgi:hypothetical protein
MSLLEDENQPKNLLAGEFSKAKIRHHHFLKYGNLPQQLILHLASYRTAT